MLAGFLKRVRFRGKARVAAILSVKVLCSLRGRVASFPPVIFFPLFARLEHRRLRVFDAKTSLWSLRAACGFSENQVDPQKKLMQVPGCEGAFMLDTPM